MKWISFNDNWPAYENRVLATVRTTIDKSYVDHVMEVDVAYSFESEMPVFTKNGIKLDADITDYPFDFGGKHKVLAWMPMPDPYRSK